MAILPTFLKFQLQLTKKRTERTPDYNMQDKNFASGIT